MNRRYSFGSKVTITIQHEPGKQCWTFQYCNSNYEIEQVASPCRPHRAGTLEFPDEIA